MLKARETIWMKTVECDRMDEKSCRVPSHTILVIWSWMELDGTRSDSYDEISSLLEKDNIIRAQCFKNKKHGFMNNQ